MTDRELLDTVKQAYWLMMDFGLLKGTAEGQRLRHRMSEAMQELLKRRDRPMACPKYSPAGKETR